jgi:hypothetical protein
MERVEERQLLSTAAGILLPGHRPAILGTPPESLRADRGGTSDHGTPGVQAAGHRAGVVRDAGSLAPMTERHAVHAPGLSPGAARTSRHRPTAVFRPADWNTSLPPFSPDQIKHAYRFDHVSFTSSVKLPSGLTLTYTAPGDGSGQTIAIVDAYVDPFIRNDVDTFDKSFRVSQYDSRSFYQAYGPSTSWLTVDNPENAPATTDKHWTAETALDVEWAHAIAPGAKIVLVEAKSALGDDLLAAAGFAIGQPGVKVVSMSWGGSAPGYQAIWDTVFLNASHLGITCVASAGDSPSVSYPADSPYVLSIGGTSLKLNSDNTYASETAWLLSGLSADASYDADPKTGYYVFDTNEGGWVVVGGTSAGAPQWAALIAIADEGRAFYGRGSLGTVQMKSAVSKSLPASDFHLGTVYNTQTGWGTPIADRIIPDLAGGKYV